MSILRSFRLKTWFYIFSTAILLPNNSIHAATLFEIDFETGLPSPLDGPNPVWSLPPDIANTSGSGNFFEVISNVAHSGSASLRFDPNGRNGLCNTCGLYSANHDAASAQIDAFIADSGEDLTLSASNGPAAYAGKFLYNKTQGFSKWTILSVSNKYTVNDKLTVRLLRPGINGEVDGFHSGDNILIARHCGIDGIFAGNVHRRSDCNDVVHQFENTSGTQAGGQSIFRRIYIRMDMTNPGSQKIRYWSNNIGGGGTGNKTHSYLVAKGSGDSFPVFPLVNTVKLNSDTSNILFKPGSGLTSGLEFERGKWYYIEEEFKAESSPAAGDGEYRLWFSESGKEGSDGSTPILELTGLFLPVADYVTFWGNFQHHSHTTGRIYLDDIKIATDTKIGSKTSDHPSTSPPTSPIIQ